MISDSLSFESETAFVDISAKLSLPMSRSAGERAEQSKYFLKCKAATHFKSLPISRRGVGGDTFRSSPIAIRPARLAEPTAPKTKHKKTMENLQIHRNTNL